MLLLLYLLAFTTRKVNQVIGRTAEFPLLGTYWARLLPEFILLGLAGFVLALPDDGRKRRISWPKLLVLGSPALVIVFLPFLYFGPLGRLMGKAILELLLLGGHASVGSFWFGVALALSFEDETAKEQISGVE
ncbi:MAG: hypothetical protein PWQ86_1764 [Bacillota bacterium]|jgi:hypothetical protein|nr:hypothetical protein [Bacillota bacterium]